MKVEIREDKVVVEGYVNAVERVSKPLWSRVGKFIERIMSGAFTRAINRNDDIKVLLNHNWNRVLGSTKDGNLELYEDNIGLHARVEISDADVITKARNGELVGWSFGFTDREVETGTEKGYPLREVKDLDLYEVSILDRTKTPAYNGTLIEARSDDNDLMIYRGEDTVEEVEIKEIVGEKNSLEPQEEAVEESKEEQPKEKIIQEEQKQEIDYSKFEEDISKMKA